MEVKRIIPDLATTLNLVFGFLSLLATASGDYTLGALFILFALCADGVDGRIARFFGVQSEMGKEMDSLCDLVSFGVAPAFLAWNFVLHTYGAIGTAAAVVFAACAMWRLARFNVNAATIHGYFMGLAAPAAGNVVAMTTLLLVTLGIDPASFGALTLVLFLVDGLLMVSHVHYPNFKGDGAEPIYAVSKVLAVILFAVILYLGRESILPALGVAVFVTYALLGIINTLVSFIAKEG